MSEDFTVVQIWFPLRICQAEKCDATWIMIRVVCYLGNIRLFILMGKMWDEDEKRSIVTVVSQHGMESEQ